VNEIDHEYTEEVVCPYCGYKHTESYEFFSDIASEEEVEIDCDCGETFIANQSVSVHYYTRKTEK